MADARDAVRITDYANPRFEPEAQAIVDAIGAMGASTVLDSDALIAAAVARTGLDDFGDPSFRERLDVIVAGLNREAGLSDLGRFNAFSQYSGLLANRLLIQDLLTRHPEIHDVEIARPIIIVGMPRTGTTHLHNLMASDPALRSLPYWESLEPVLSRHEAVPPGGRDPRLDRTDLATGTLELVMPLFPRMHEMTTDHVHEEIQLLAIDLSTMLFETSTRLPSWRDYYLAHDQTAHYEYMKTVLKVCTWSRGSGEPVRWVLKSPQHLEQFAVLRRTFPDATYVVTYRDPAAIVASFVTMVTYTARMNAAMIDPHWYGSYWEDRIERMLRACTVDRELLPADRTIDVHFREFMRDDIATVGRIYEIAGQPFDAAAQSAMRRFMADHPRGKFGRIRYDLADFGLDEDRLRERFRFYVDAFDVEEERLNA